MKKKENIELGDHYPAGADRAAAAPRPDPEINLGLAIV